MDSLELFQQREGLIELSLLDDNFSTIETAVETLESSVTTLQTDVSSLTSALSISGGTSSVLYVDSANKRLGVGDANTPAATLEVEGDGSPLILNSKNPTSNKILLQDSGVTRSFIGASFTDSILVKNSTNQTVLRASSSGNVTAPKHSWFSVRTTGNGQSITASNTDKIINWSGTGGGYGVGDDFADNTYTVPVSGKYIFQINLWLYGVTNIVGDQSANLDIRVNGTDVGPSLFPYRITTSNMFISHSSQVFELQQGDEVELYLQAVNCDFTVFQSNCYWSGYLLF